MLSHRSSLLLPFVAGLSLALTGCYKAEFTGLACQSSQECGDLVCVDGACVDAEPGGLETTVASTGGTPAATTGGSDSADGSTGESEPIQGTDGCCNKLDVLFVIDQSLSMELQCHEETFSAAIFGMTEPVYKTITENIDSFHIGFTTASIAPGNPPECQHIGSLLRGTTGDECFGDKLHNKPYLISEDQQETSTFLESLYCLLRVGTVLDLPEAEMEQQDDARPIKAMLEALADAANAPGGCNEGFSRPGVPLLVVMMTNSDQAPYLPVPDGEEPIDWWRMTHTQKELDAAEGQKRVGFILMNAPDVLPNDGLCMPEAGQSRIPNYYGMVNEDLKRRYDICSMMPDEWLLGDKCKPAAGEKLTNFSEFFMSALDDLTCDVCAP